MIHKSGRTVAVPESSRTNENDRLPIDALGRVEGRDSIVEGRDLADVRPQPSLPHPLDDLTQLRAIGHDDEVDRQTVCRWAARPVPMTYAPYSYASCAAIEPTAPAAPCTRTLCPA